VQPGRMFVYETGQPVPRFIIDPPPGNLRLESREEWRLRKSNHVV